MLKVAFWPDVRKIGCAKIQRELNCDPEIARHFPTDMITMKMLDGPVWIDFANLAQWQHIAKQWAKDDAWEAETKTRSALVH